MTTAKDIMNKIQEEGVEFVRLQFTDMFGHLKNVAVTAGQLSKILVDKYRIDGAVLFDNAPGSYEGELVLEPDYDTFTILPWRPQQGKVAKFMCDVCYPDGTLYEMSPRTILKNVIDEAAAKGYTFMIRPECEFFLFHMDETGLPTTITHEEAGVMDVGPVDFGENARREMVLLLEQMGFEIESSYHEKAPAQHEIDFTETGTLQAADAIMTFRFAVRSIAKRFGMYATFMPKPKTEEAGSGMHLNFTVFKDDVNIIDSDKREINGLTRDFINGILRHSTALCAYTNPTVNSYKRILLALDDAKTTSDYDISTTYMRIREGLFEPAIELRFPDSAANPYLALALCISAGLEGIEDGNGANIPARLPIANVKGMPENLREALLCADNDPFIGKVLGDDFARIYTDSKLDEWNRYMRDVSDWEIRNYLYKF